MASTMMLVIIPSNVFVVRVHMELVRGIRLRDGGEIKTAPISDTSYLEDFNLRVEARTAGKVPRMTPDSGQLARPGALKDAARHQAPMPRGCLLHHDDGHIRARVVDHGFDGVRPLQRVAVLIIAIAISSNFWRGSERRLHCRRATAKVDFEA